MVLGIDPGTRVVGYGAVVVSRTGPRFYACGVLRTSARADVPARLGALRLELDALLAKLAPDVVVVEQAFAHKNTQSALRIGEGRGVALSCAAVIGARIEQYPPAVAKKALLGHGAADKSQVAAMVARLLGLSEVPEPFDATDALALALAFLQRDAFAQRLNASSTARPPVAARAVSRR